MNRRQAKALKYGTTLYHKTLTNADGTAMRFRVSGKPKTWKTRPKDVQVPVKWGLKLSYYMGNTPDCDLHYRDVLLYDPTEKD